MSEKKQPVDLGLLEEDDEFEEFPAEGERRGLGLADGDSGFGLEEAGQRGPRAQGRPREVWTQRPALEALRVRPSVPPASGSSRPGGGSPGRLNASCFLLGPPRRRCPGGLVLFLFSRLPRS